MESRITSEATARFLQEESVAFVAKHLKLSALNDTGLSRVSSIFIKHLSVKKKKKASIL